MSKTGMTLAVAAGWGAFAMNATAMTFGFTAITNNGGVAGDAEGEIFVTVSDLGSGQALFTFNVNPGHEFGIHAVYFDDGALLTLADLVDDDQNGGDSGVDFSQGATPPNLPAGNTVGFEATPGLTASADPPVGGPTGNSVNGGESLGVIFDLETGTTFADLLAALDLGFADGGLVIGIHVVGMGEENQFSNSYVTDGDDEPVIPLPAGAALGLVGLAPVMARRRR